MNDIVINTEQLRNFTSKLPQDPPSNFCIAPFQSTRQNAHGRNSPCAFGAGEWHHGNLSPAERWNSAELNQLRQEFINGEKPSTCSRCWAEEDAGKKSLRQRQFEYFPDDYEKFVRSGNWVNGPKTAVFKVSNVCNLACRSCGGWDTNSYTIEGQYYLKEYNTRTPSDKLHNRFIPLLPPKHMDFSQYYNIADNLEKIDFFGGEPFLNTSQLELLEYLSNKGISKNITLFYSTNCTNYPTERLKQLWNEFKRVEISVSIDGINDQFEYMRWPGKWADTQKVLDYLLDLKNKLKCELYIMSGLTISLLNVWYADEVYDWLKNKIGDVYINMVNSPDYLSLHIVPTHVKYAIKHHIKHPEVLGYIDINESNSKAWKQFIIWTKRQDLYRKQSFEKIVPNFYSIIKDDWDSTTDLSEDNFNGNNK